MGKDRDSLEVMVARIDERVEVQGKNWDKHWKKHEDIDSRIDVIEQDKAFIKGGWWGIAKLGGLVVGIFTLVKILQELYWYLKPTIIN